MTRRWYALLFLLLANQGLASPDLCNRIEASFARGDLDELLAIDLELAGDYWRAFHAYRVAAFTIQRDELSLARQHLKQGVRAIKRVREERPDDIEATVLSGMLYGQRFIVGRGFGWIAGIKGYRLLKRAEGLAPDNPRVLLARGVGEILAPGLLRSKPEQARATLAHGLAGIDNPPCTDGTWGEVDLALWLGRAYLALDKPDEAEASFKRALALSPGNVWVMAAAQGEGYVWANEELQSLDSL